MIIEVVEHFFSCPYCAAEISMLLDPSDNGQPYIEDCEVCCRPIRVQFEIDGLEVVLFDASSIEQ
jgi:hypothetical protein